MSPHSQRPAGDLSLEEVPLLARLRLQQARRRRWRCVCGHSGACAKCRCPPLAQVVCFFVVVLAAAAGVYMYDHLMVPPPAPFEPENPSSSLVACPWHHAQDSASEPAPAVIENGTWSTSVCWAPQRWADSYQLQADNWWLNETLVFSTLYHGRGTNFTLSQLLPGTRYHLRVVAIGADNTTKALSPTMAFTTYDQGLCGNHADLVQFRARRLVMKAGIQSCIEVRDLLIASALSVAFFRRL